MLVLATVYLTLSFAGRAGAYTPSRADRTPTPASVCPFPAHPDKGYPPGQPAYTYNDCLWGYILNPNNALTNQTGIDANNAYFTANFAMPPHSKIILHGQFPHSRFYSFTTYGTVNGTVGVATSWIFDYQINPDPGSQNPFQPGVRRDVRNRNFTLTISSEVKPANPAPNTLYAGAAGQTDQVQQINVTLRYYLPDRLYLPVTPTSNLMGGVRTTDPHPRARRRDDLHRQGHVQGRELHPRIPQRGYLLLVGCSQRPLRLPAPSRPARPPGHARA